MNKEIWKDIPEYEGLYQASNLGNIKSLERKRIDRNEILKSKILTKHLKENGYEIVTLCKNRKEVKKYVHRLVALTFISNPNNYNEINHINENKQDNRVVNLEWCNRKYNCNYGLRNMKCYKKILQYDLQDNFIKEWNSIKSIKKYFEKKDNDSGISCCIHGKQKTAFGYKWKLKNNIGAMFKEE